MTLRSLLCAMGAACLAAACDSASRAGETIAPEGGPRPDGPAVGAGGVSSAGTSSLGGAPGGGRSSGAVPSFAGGGAVSSSGAPSTAGGAGGFASSGGAPSTAGGAGGFASSGGAPSSGGTGGATYGSIVPLYSYPTDPAWAAIAVAKAAHPDVAVIAIVNPNNGPGTKADGAFTRGIAALVSAGIVPIGYVSTSYTNRGEPAVKADVDSWHTQYPSTQGIFFDEQSNKAGDEAFYRDVSSYAKSEGFTLTVGNPGTSVPASFLDTVDVMLIYESAGAPPASSLTRYAPQRSHFGVIPYAAAFDAAYAKSAVKSVAYVYVTDDDLPNPWDTLPTFFEPLLAALEP